MSRGGGVVFVKAIPTKYAGCEFRSRIEARHAVFMDTLGVAWEYEPEGYESDEGWRYLPDFWLPGLEAFLEIKGKEPTAEEKIKAAGLAEATKHPVYIFYGGMQKPSGQNKTVSDGTRAVGYGANRTVFGWDKRTAMFLWAECVQCHGVGIIGLDARGRVNRSICPCVSATLHPYSTRLSKAYEAARSAKFEHGQSGMEKYSMPKRRRRPVPVFTPAKARPE